MVNSSSITNYNYFNGNNINNSGKITATTPISNNITEREKENGFFVNHNLIKHMKKKLRIKKMIIKEILHEGL